MVASWLLMKEKWSRAWKQTRAKFSLKGTADLLKGTPPPPPGPARDRKWVEQSHKTTPTSIVPNTYHQSGQWPSGWILY